MKGLIKKDTILIMQQKGIVLILIFLIIGLSAFINKDGNSNFIYGFAGGYMALLSAMMGLSTISYDEADNGYPYLMSMPFTRGMYVSGKYLICLISSLAGSVLSAILITLGSLINGQSIEVLSLISTLGVIIAVGTLVSSIGIPAYLRFGSQKGMYVVLLICAVIAAAVIGLVKIIGKIGIDVQEVLADFSNLNEGAAVSLAIAVSAVIMSISWYISQKLMASKEF